MSLKHTQALRLLNVRLKRERAASRHKRLRKLSQVMCERPLNWWKPDTPGERAKDDSVLVFEYAVLLMKQRHGS